jgi:uncharacterized protein
MPRSPETTLQAFLEDSSRPSDTLTYHELQGFLFAMASAPELVMPSAWMPIVFGDGGAEYASTEEARVITTALMAVYNSINAAVFEGRAALPADCRFREPPLANLEDDAPIAQWSRGFLHGHQWLQESWDAYVPKKLDEEYASMLLTLSFFASRELAEAFCAETGGTRELAAMTATMMKVFPEAMSEYAHLGRSIQQVIAEAEAEESPQSQGRKIGRNEPCPCGSGRKYKKCCGAMA